MKILIVSKCPTHPTNAGNRWGILAQANILGKLGAEVHFLYVEERALSKGRKDEFDEMYNATKEYWGERFHHYRVPLLVKAWFNVKKRFYTLNGRRAKCDSYFPCGLISHVRKLSLKESFDSCIVNYYYLTKLLDNISIPKKACFTHDNYTYKDIRLNCKPKDCDVTADANEMAKAMQRSHHIFAVQDEETIFFQQLSPNSSLYNIYSKYDYHAQSVANNQNILFLSGNNQYNQNGIRWFLKSVFPLIRNRFPDARLVIGGSICKVLNDIHMQGVELLGYIDNPVDFYAKGDVAINPVYQGTGLKIKTFEAISYDKVTMVHPHSMAGVFKREQAPLFASEKPEEWVSFLDKIWSNPDEIMTIKNKNKEYLEEMNAFIIKEYKRFLSANK